MKLPLRTMKLGIPLVAGLAVAGVTTGLLLVTGRANRAPVILFPNATASPVFHAGQQDAPVTDGDTPLMAMSVVNQAEARAKTNELLAQMYVVQQQQYLTEVKLLAELTRQGDTPAGDCKP